MYVIHVWKCQIRHDVQNSGNNKIVNLFIIIIVFNVDIDIDI